MPGSKSNFFEKAVLDWAFPPSGGGTSYTPPATLYIALCTGTAPTADPNTLNEVSSSGTGYSRVAINNGGPNSIWSAAQESSGVTTKKNNADITFPQATASWGTITWMAIVDSNNNILVWGTLSSAVTINSGDAAVFRANNITIQED